MEIDSDFYRTLGEFIDFEAGTGFEPPGETVKYDGLQSVNIEKLEEALGSISIAPSRLALSGAKGEGELAVDVEETTTTTTTTTIAPTTAAGSEPTAAAAGSEETPGTAGEEGGWGIGVWIIFGAVVLAAAIFFGGKVVRRPSSIPGLDEIPDIPDDIPGPFDAQRTGRDQSGQQFVGGSETDLDYDPESGWKRDSGSYGGIGGSGSYEPSAPRDAFGESPADGGFVEPDDEVVATDEGNLPEPEPMEAEPVDPAPNGEEGDEPDDGEFKETIL